jgi:hypothetical protein
MVKELKFGLMGLNMKVLIREIVNQIGEWRNNKANGKGKFWHVDGDIYEGSIRVSVLKKLRPMGRG